jgi:hypothetical protein
MSLRSRRRLSAAVALVLATAVAPFAGSTSASAAPTPSTRHIQKGGTAVFTPPRPPSDGTPSAPSSELRPQIGSEEGSDAARAAAAGSSGFDRSLARRNNSAGRAGGRAQAVPDSGVSTAQPNGIIRTGPQVLTSFDGINHRDQRTANGGNQFSLEPPDQALCVGGGFVVEAVNDALQVYNADGTDRTGVIDLNTFLGYPPAINRTTGVRGPFIVDPVCLFDPTTKTFFFAALTIEVDAAGNQTGGNTLDIAVTKDPTGTWNIYHLDATDDGRNGTPVHPNCPCLGDYPHVGVDANGFYLTTNEYSFFGPEFNSAQVYAFSKRALARGDADVLVTQFDTTGADQGRNGFTIWPAQSPNDGQYSRAASGSEFFLSSNAAPEATGEPDIIPSDSILAWSLTNTKSLDSPAPNVRLQNTRVRVDTYDGPPPANQKPGSLPLADCLNDDACAPNLLGPGATDPFKPEVLSNLDSIDTRMLQVSYANGSLYGALGTAVQVGGATKAGIAWYIVRPESSRFSLSARLAAQGKLGLAGNNLIFPTIGINANGKGVIAFTLVGSTFHPSAAYAAFDGRTGAGSIFVAKAGVGPQDGFSGYKAFGNPAGTTRPRWGDYGATAVDGDNIWVATEYIGQTCTFAQYTAAPFGSCGGTRTALANWDTRISKIKP